MQLHSCPAVQLNCVSTYAKHCFHTPALSVCVLQEAHVVQPAPRKMIIFCFKPLRGCAPSLATERSSFLLLCVAVDVQHRVCHHDALRAHAAPGGGA